MNAAGTTNRSSSVRMLLNTRSSSQSINKSICLLYLNAASKFRQDLLKEVNGFKLKKISVRSSYKEK